MSARNLPVILTPQARRDLSDIELYTAQQWGNQQRRASMAKLEKALQDLAEFPHLGRSRDELGAGLRSYPIGEHVIYYRVDPGKLTVLRVLHRTMDASTTLGD
ncbi:MAG: plasmid stabilization protein ParE [Chloroflexota bacterium]